MDTTASAARRASARVHAHLASIQAAADAASGARADAGASAVGGTSTLSLATAPTVQREGAHGPRAASGGGGARPASGARASSGGPPPAAGQAASAAGSSFVSARGGAVGSAIGGGGGGGAGMPRTSADSGWSVRTADVSTAPSQSHTYERVTRRDGGVASTAGGTVGTVGSAMGGDTASRPAGARGGGVQKGKVGGSSAEWAALVRQVLVS